MQTLAHREARNCVPRHLLEKQSFYQGAGNWSLDWVTNPQIYKHWSFLFHLCLTFWFLLDIQTLELFIGNVSISTLPTVCPHPLRILVRFLQILTLNCSLSKEFFFPKRNDEFWKIKRSGLIALMKICRPWPFKYWTWTIKISLLIDHVVIKVSKCWIYMSNTCNISVNIGAEREMIMPLWIALDLLSFM